MRKAIEKELDENHRETTLDKLNRKFPVSTVISFENGIVNSQKVYKALLSKDNLTSFIEYQLQVLDSSLKQLLNYNNRILFYQT